MAAQLLADQRGGDYHIYPEHIRNIPVPIASKEIQQAIAEISKDLLYRKANNLDCAAALNELNAMVATLYQQG